MDENFPKLRMDAKAQINKVQEHQAVKIPKKMYISIYYIQILGNQRQRKYWKKPKKGGKNYIGAKIRNTADFSSKIMQAREWSKLSKLLKRKKLLI